MPEVGQTGDADTVRDIGVPGTKLGFNGQPQSADALRGGETLPLSLVAMVGDQ